MSYTPSPLDVATVAAPPELANLIERLAENTHDVWARKRIAEGWTHGPEKDAAAKKTPFLVPYAELPESEKETDRVMVKNSLLAAVKLGCRIEPPAELSKPPTAVEESSLAAWQQHLEQELGNKERAWTYDMDDAPELASGKMEPFPALKRALEFAQQHLYSAWKDADSQAIRHQRRHRTVAKWAIFAGGTAIVLGILELLCSGFASHAWKLLLSGVELAAALAALAAVVVGLIRRTQRNWLACRQAAERLRVLKFGALASPELWCDFPSWSAGIEKEISGLRNLSYEDAEEWIKGGSAETPLPEMPSCPVPVAETAALAAFYRWKRQSFQHAFFTKRAEQHKHDMWLLRLRVPMILFFVSVALVMVHAIMESLAHEEPHGFAWVSCFVALAAGLPVAGFCLRAWFSAFELPRRASLFESKARQLHDAIERVQQDERDIGKTLYHITQGEHFFRTEHREWCRLIAEAEWFL